MAARLRITARKLSTMLEPVDGAGFRVGVDGERVPKMASPRAITPKTPTTAGEGRDALGFGPLVVPSKSTQSSSPVQYSSRAALAEKAGYLRL
jgi:hypothetical protein